MRWRDAPYMAERCTTPVQPLRRRCATAGLPLHAGSAQTLPSMRPHRILSVRRRLGLPGSASGQPGRPCWLDPRRRAGGSSSAVRRRSLRRATCCTGGTGCPERACRGVRTRCSDDLVWLPYALRRCTRLSPGTGRCWDRARALAHGRSRCRNEEQDRYFEPGRTPTAVPRLYRARGCGRWSGPCTQGEHGLPLIGRRRLERRL